MKNERRMVPKETQSSLHSLTPVSKHRKFQIETQNNTGKENSQSLCSDHWLPPHIVGAKQSVSAIQVFLFFSPPNIFKIIYG